MLFLFSLFAGQCQTAQKGTMWLCLLSLENLSILSISLLCPEKFSNMDAVVGLVLREMISLTQRRILPLWQLYHILLFRDISKIKMLKPGSTTIISRNFMMRHLFITSFLPLSCGYKLAMTTFRQKIKRQFLAIRGVSFWESFPGRVVRRQIISFKILLNGS